MKAARMKIFQLALTLLVVFSLVVLAGRAGAQALLPQFETVFNAYRSLSSLHTVSSQVLTLKVGEEKLSFQRKVDFWWKQGGTFLLQDTGIFAPVISCDGRRVYVTVKRAGLALYDKPKRAVPDVDEFFWAFVTPMNLPVELDLHLLQDFDPMQYRGSVSNDKVVVEGKGVTYYYWIDPATSLMSRWEMHTTLPLEALNLPLSNAARQQLPQQVQVDFSAKYLKVEKNPAWPRQITAALVPSSEYSRSPLDEEPAKPKPTEKPKDKQGTETSQKPKEKPLNFTLKDIIGKPVSLSDFAGKPLIIDFFNTGCPHCMQELPALENLAAKYASQGLKVLLISFDRSKELAKQAIAGRPHLILLYDLPEAQRLGNQFKVVYIPCTLYLNRDHVIVDETIGYSPSMDFSKQLRAMGVNP